VIEAIKLIEAGYAAECDEVWLVTCVAEAQRRRLVGRGSPAAEADQRIAAQGDLTARLGPLSTRVIDASGNREATRRLVTAAWEAALEASPD